MNAEILSRWGFDAPRLAFAGRTAGAACAAFALAWLIGLEHPQWSGMTVWAASQPTRGELLEKSFFRMAGTISGAFVGVGLVTASTVHPMLLVAGLALWVGLCAGIGNLQRGFVSYGTILAGYTAAMVALLDAAHPDQALSLGVDRLATALIGVIVATAVGFFFAPPAASVPLRAELRIWLADLAEALAGPPQRETAHRLLSRIAAVEERLEPYGAGSLRSRREVRATRALLSASIPLLLWSHGAKAPPAAAVSEALQAAAQALRAEELEVALGALRRAAGLEPPRSDLREGLGDLEAALRDWREAGAHVERARPVALHRDWIGAREAMIRAMLVLMVFGSLWVFSGWSAGAFMLLGASVMVSMFSTFENPVLTMRFVFIGQSLGVLGALACRWLAWPLAESEGGVILLTLPFILFGALLSGWRRTALVSFDYNMVLLLMLQPAWPLTGSFGASVGVGLAILAAPLAAMLAYRFIYPIGVRRRLDTLIRMMLQDLEDIAADPRALERRRLWRARLHHRMLRLARLSERSGRGDLSALDGGLALLDLSHVAMRGHERLAQPETSPADRRAMEMVLGRMRRIRTRPGRLEGALERASRRISGPDADLLARAAEACARNSQFFGRDPKPDSASTA